MTGHSFERVSETFVLSTMNTLEPAPPDLQPISTLDQVPDAVSSPHDAPAEIRFGIHRHHDRPDMPAFVVTYRDVETHKWGGSGPAHPLRKRSFGPVRATEHSIIRDADHTCVSAIQVGGPHPEERPT